MLDFSHLPLLALIYFAAILLLLEMGRRLGQRHLRIDPKGARTGISAIDGAVFGLSGLLIAFTFSGGAERLDARRTMIVAETNAIGTAWLRLDLLPAEDQPALRQLFRDYVDSRIALYQHLGDPDRVRSNTAKVQSLQLGIWKSSVTAMQHMPVPNLGVSLLQALNEMIDITTTRAVALKTHPPMLIYLTLIALTLINALLIGYGMAGSRQRYWLHSIGYAVVIVSALYVIIDFEFPRAGVIRVDSFDQIMVDQRNSMG